MRVTRSKGGAVPWFFALGLVTTALGALACSDSSDGDGGSSETGGTGGTNPEPCVNSSCTCMDGRVGEVPCTRDEANRCSCALECDCSACPAFEVDEPPPFDACGGEPVGVWRGLVFAAQGFHLSSLGEAGGECPVDFTMASPSVEFLLRFDDSADLEIYRSAFSVSGNLLDSCVREVFQGVGCNGLEVANDGSCSLQDCGICSCTLPLLELAGGGTWVASAGTLLISLNSGARGTWDHCVQSDRLVLREASGVRFELERIQVMGTPAPCAERSSETCATSVGCTWDGSECSGAVAATCSLRDYGRVPGCDIVP